MKVVAASRNYLVMFVSSRWRIRLLGMNTTKTAGKTIEPLPKSRIELVRGKFPDGGTTFMLRLMRGNLPIADIEALLIILIEPSELANLRQAALNEPLL